MAGGAVPAASAGRQRDYPTTPYPRPTRPTMLPRLTPQFDDTRAGKKRSVFFAIGLATGFLCIVAATSALFQSAANAPVAAILIILGSMAFGFSVMTAMGRLGWLFQAE